MTPSDPRVFFASERTLLAWMRTGIAIVGLGFIVSRFGLFLQLVAAQSPGHATRISAVSSSGIGIFFVLIGAVSVAVATVQHGRFIQTLPEIDRPAEYSRHWALWLSGLVCAASFALAIYLAATM
ncbi:MAG: DUF202 domain-containing protein [Usitatibacteraceae bacterium]